MNERNSLFAVVCVFASFVSFVGAVVCAAAGEYHHSSIAGIVSSSLWYVVVTYVYFQEEV